jgi:hypothetical protein
VAVAVAATVAVVGPAPAPAGAAPPVTYTYVVRTRGVVRSDVEQFAAHAAATYADPRGWSLGGSIRFVRVSGPATFTLWLAAANQMTSFSSACSSFYSCTVGADVIVNDDRWAGGSPSWPGSVDDYRHMVVNHETGHWLGLHHPCEGGPCVPPGQLAPVMMQQSKGLYGDLPNPWPLPSERQRVADARGVPVLSGSQGPPPVVGLTATPDGGGYWLVASDGGIFPFGDAGGYGSTGGMHLNRPVVGMAGTRDGRGYWLVAADGGVFPFGDAVGYGSRAGAPAAAAAAAPVRAPGDAVSAPGTQVVSE